MSRPIQKNFNWLSRLMYYGSPIHQPFGLNQIVSPVIDVSQDWPANMTIPVATGYTSIAGVIQSTLITVPAQTHAMIERWAVQGVFAAGDIVLAFIQEGGLASQAVSTMQAGFGAAQFAALDATSGRAIYLPAGWRALISHQSAAGGVAFTHSAQIRTAPESQPLLPLV